MYRRLLVAMVLVMCFQLFASEQLTFKGDTIGFGNWDYKPEIQFVTNMTDSPVSIDSIIFTWEEGDEVQEDRIGIAFEMENSRTGKNGRGFMLTATDIITLNDTTFCFNLRELEDEIVFLPHEKTMLGSFLFGRCIGCAGVAGTDVVRADVNITVTFVNDQSGRDTVVFVGMKYNFIQSGVIDNNVTDLKITGKSALEDNVFLVSGRKLAAFRKMNAVKVLPMNVYYRKSGMVPMKGYVPVK